MFFKWSIVLTMMVALSTTIIHQIEANPYKAPPPPPPPEPKVLDKITKLKLDISADIEKIPAPPPPPGPPKDPYEGGAVIQLNVKEEEAAPPPPPPPPPPPSYPKITYMPAISYPAPYPPAEMPDYPPEMPYSTKPEGYGPPPEKEKAPNYYKMPSSDVPYYETSSKKVKYSSSKRKATYLPPASDSDAVYRAPPAPPTAHHEERTYDRPVEAPNYYYETSTETSTKNNQGQSLSPEEEALFFNIPPSTQGGRAQAERGPVIHRVIYLPSDASDEAAAAAAAQGSSPAEHERNSEHAYHHGGRSGIPYYETSSQTTSESSRNSREHRPYRSRDLSISRHENGGTVINIPSASGQIRSRIRAPEPSFIDIPPTSSSKKRRIRPPSDDDYVNIPAGRRSKREGRRIKRSVDDDPISTSPKSFHITEPIALRKITKFHKPMFKYVNIQKQQNNLRPITDFNEIFATEQTTTTVAEESKNEETKIISPNNSNTYLADLQILPIMDFQKLIPFYQTNVNGNIDDNAEIQAGLERQMENSFRMLYPNDVLTLF